MIIYLDVVFFLNLVYDFSLLCLLSRLRGRKLRAGRIFFSSLLGGGLSLVGFVPYFQPILSAALRYLSPFLMCGVGFSPFSLKDTVISGICFLVLSFAVSGGMFFFGTGFFVLVVAMWALLCFRGKIRRKYKNVKLIFEGKTAEILGFCDSGNLLEYNGMPVILAKTEVFKQLFGEGFSSGNATEFAPMRVVYVPYKTLGKEGVVMGVRLDMAQIEGRIFNDVILAVLGEDFSEQAILHGSMV